jgi:hypothetical protein
MSALDRLKETPSWDWPEQAALLIKQQLRNDDLTEQLEAVELAGDLVVMDDEMAGLLVGIIQGGGSAEVRGRAAIALGPALEEAFEVGFDDELDAEFDARVVSESRIVEIRRVLESVYRDADQPDVVRRMCLEASVRAPQDWHNAAVAAAYQSSDKSWKMTALFCMGRVSGFEANIVKSLQSDDIDLVVEAVRSAGLAEVGAAGPTVLDLAAAETQAPRVRYAAVEALALLETPGSDELLVALTESDDEVLSELAFEALEERRVFSEPPDSY